MERDLVTQVFFSDFLLQGRPNNVLEEGCLGKHASLQYLTQLALGVI